VKNAHAQNVAKRSKPSRLSRDGSVALAITCGDGIRRNCAEFEEIFFKKLVLDTIFVLYCLWAGIRTCVHCVFIFKDTEPSPLQDSFSVRQQGGLPGPPPRVTVVRQYNINCLTVYGKQCQGVNLGRKWGENEGCFPASGIQNKYAG
jgi:hypothetical protein